MDAILINPDATARRLSLPDDPAGQSEALAANVGHPVETAYYHRQAVLHLNGNSQTDMQPNFPVWALASAWRRIRLPYPLCGPFVITGPAEGARYSDLHADLLAQAEHAVHCARELRGQPGPPLPEADRGWEAA